MYQKLQVRTVVTQPLRKIVPSRAPSASNMIDNNGMRLANICATTSCVSLHIHKLIQPEQNLAEVGEGRSTCGPGVLAGGLI